MSRSEQTTELKFVVKNTLIVAEIQRSVAFYRDVLGATVLSQGRPTFLRLGNVGIAVYMRDPDGCLVEVGQTTMTPGPLDLYN